MRKSSLCILYLASFLLVNVVCGPTSAHTGEPTALPDVASGGTKVPVGGSVKVDDQGPTIVSEEGELRQIQNWDQLSEQEKEVAWKRVKKRNWERLESLRKYSEEVSKHDSTLDDEGEDDRPLEDRFIKAQQHLAAFQDSLIRLKAKGQGIPGFEGVEELLENPSSAEKHKVDPAELRRKLQELQKNTEQLKKEKGIRHTEL